jgi:undecaprenyl-diphosphatase
MADAEAPWLVAVAEWFHVVGAAPVAVVIAVAVGVGFLVARKWDLALAWTAIVGGAQISSTVTKLLVDRPRPLDALVHESTAAYPSGHATVSGAAMAIGLAVLLGLMWPRRHNLFLWIGVTYAVLMAVSRTYLRVHWLTDVIGGLALGCAFVLVVATLVQQRASDDVV